MTPPAGEPLTFFLLAEEFGPLTTTTELIDFLWLGSQRLQEQSRTDADRAGERLLVVAARETLTPERWKCWFEIVGEESGHRYGRFAIFMEAEDGGLVPESCERLELLTTVMLRATLNGPERFTADEKQALADGYRLAMQNGSEGPVRCDFCDRSFLFYREALAHENACQHRS